MKAEREYPIAVITDKGARWSGTGHPWIFGSDIQSVEPGAADGGLVDIVTRRGQYIGTGFYNSASKITLRIVSRNANDRFDEAFWRRRVQYAWDYRRQVMPADLSCCRVVFGEADFLPGLTADLFTDVLVTETLCAGIERIKPVLFPILAEVLAAGGHPIRGIYEREDMAQRELEGLERCDGWSELAPHSGGTVTEITENGIRYRVDFENGQKTGFFLDQKYNRRAAAAIASGRHVLDCFTHTGSFALNTCFGGAASVTAVDISAAALETAASNAALNGADIRFIRADVFDLLPQLRRGEYDFIILDPPAFTKSRQTVRNAAAGYREINRRAMKALPRGGYLATCSCSHFMTDTLFRREIERAACDAEVQLRCIEGRRQSPDHPILLGAPETEYLKFYLYQVV